MLFSGLFSLYLYPPEFPNKIRRWNINILSAVFLQKNCGFLRIYGRPGAEYILSAVYFELVEYSKCSGFGYSKCSRVWHMFFWIF